MLGINLQMRSKAALLSIAICYSIGLDYAVAADATRGLSKSEIKEISSSNESFVVLDKTAKDVFKSLASLSLDASRSLKNVVARINGGKSIVSQKEALVAIAELPNVLSGYKSVFSPEQISEISKNAAAILNNVKESSITLEDGKNSKIVWICRNDCKQLDNCGTKLAADVIAPDTKDNSTLCFDGNLAVHPEQKTLTNEINPVKLNEVGCCEVDEDGTTKFSGNVSINKNASISEDGELLVNNISPVLGEDCEFDADLDGHICVHGDLAIDGNACKDSHRLLVNKISGVTRDEDGECVASADCIVRFEDTFAIAGKCKDQKKILVNEINPVKLDSNGCPVEDDSKDGQICISGNLVIAPDRMLSVARICGVEDPCTPGESSVEICNPLFTGKICFGDDIAITGGHKLFVNEIDPDNECYPAATCTSFSGDISLPAPFKILVNEINPVSSDDFCTPDDDGITCFSGNVAVHPGTCEEGPYGDHRHKLLVNWIDPIKVIEGICVEDHSVGAATCFSGDLAVDQDRKLLVNEINPVKIGQDGCCEIDDDGVTCFSGNVAIPGDCGGHELRVNNIVPAFGCESNPCGTTCIDGTFAITPSPEKCAHKLLVNKIDPVRIDPYTGCCVEDVDGCTQFSGNVSIPHKKLLVNEINPVSAYSPCEADDNGVTCFSGNVAIPGDCGGHELRVNNIVSVKENPYTGECEKDPCGTICLEGIVAIKPTKCSKLLVNEINPVKIDPITGCCVEDEDGKTCFSGNVVINGRLCVSGEILGSDGECGCSKVGRICVGSTIAIAGDCQNPNHTEPELRVNTIVPVIPDGADKCERDDCGTICVDGTLAISPKPSNIKDSCESECQHRLLVNKIDPVKIVENCCVSDVNGTTCFGGDVVINADKTLYVNKICASKDCCTPDEHGDVEVCGEFCFDIVPVKNEVFVNSINPINPYTCERGDGVTCLSGNMAVTGYRCDDPEAGPTKRLLVNHICPVNNCEQDENGITEFCGNVAITGLCGDPIVNKLLVNNIDPVKFEKGCLVENDYGVTCFGGFLGVNNGKELRTNLITPIASQNECCDADLDGCVDIAGDLCIVDPRSVRIGDPHGTTGGRLHVWGQKGVTIAPNATETELTVNFAGTPISPTGGVVRLYLVGNKANAAASNKPVFYKAHYIMTPSGGFKISESTLNASGAINGDGVINASFSGMPTDASHQIRIRLKNNTGSSSTLKASLYYEISAEDALSAV